MKEYFYTNAQLRNVLENSSGEIDWEEIGFNVKEVRELQVQYTVNGTVESVLPIFNKQKFNARLGNLIALGLDRESFYKVISEDEMIKIKEEQILKQEEQTLNKYKRESELNRATNQRLDELEVATTELMVENLQLKGVIK